MQVNRDNVLRARGILLAEADRLDSEMVQLWERGNAYSRRLRRRSRVPRRDTAHSPSESTALIEQCRQYNRDLREAAYALDATARSYGWTEEEIATSFRAGG